MKKDNKIKINLNKRNEIIFPQDSLIHNKSYHKLREILDNLEPISSDEKNKDCINVNRRFDNILISGERGSGKTVFINNIKNQCEDFLEKYYFLPPLDPSVLSSTKQFENSESFCLLLLGHLVKNIERKLDESNESSIVEKFYQKLNEISDIISYIKSSEKVVSESQGLNDLLNCKDATKAEDLMHKILKLVSMQILNERRICFILDDIDMTFHTTYTILETVRKYFSSPYCLCILTGKIEQYKEMIENSLLMYYNKEYIHYNNQFTREAKNKCVAYLDKIVPISNRIILPQLEEIINDKSQEICLYNDENEIHINSLQERFSNFLIPKNSGNNKEMILKIQNGLRNQFMFEVFHQLSLRNALQLYQMIMKLPVKKNYKNDSHTNDRIKLLEYLSNMNIFSDDSLYNTFVNQTLRIEKNNGEFRDVNPIADFLQLNYQRFVREWIPNKNNFREKNNVIVYNNFIQIENSTDKTEDTSLLIKELLILEKEIDGEVIQYMNPCMFLIKCVSFYIYSMEDYLTALPQIDNLFIKGEQILPINSAMFFLVSSHLFNLKQKYDVTFPHKIEDQLSVSEIYIILLLIYKICKDFFEKKSAKIIQEMNEYQICLELVDALKEEIKKIDSRELFHIDFTQGVIGKFYTKQDIV